jgi:hypothetical protein
VADPKGGVWVKGQKVDKYKKTPSKKSKLTGPRPPINPRSDKLSPTMDDQRRMKSEALAGARAFDRSSKDYMGRPKK